MNLLSVYNKFTIKAHVLYRYILAKKSKKHYLRLFKQHNIKYRKLSKIQRKEVDKVWNGKVKDYTTHELYYSVTGKFDAKICSELLFRTKIELLLNNQVLKKAWADKNFFERLLPNGNFPVAVIRNINGMFYNRNYELISYKQALEIASNYKKLIIKPSIDGGLGRDVKLINSLNEASVEFDNYSKNYIVQEVIEQHEVLAAFSTRSVNVMRVNSLNVNGSVSILSVALRAGTGGSVTDNYITSDGKGMVVMGIDEKGIIRDKGVYSCGVSISELSNGVKFDGIKIPNFEKIKECVEKAHTQLPYFGFVGWDVTIDKNGEPIIMEYNIKGMGMLYYQYVNGPLFANRTEEIIKLLK